MILNYTVPQTNTGSLVSMHLGEQMNSIKGTRQNCPVISREGTFIHFLILSCKKKNKRREENNESQKIRHWRLFNKNTSLCKDQFNVYRLTPVQWRVVKSLNKTTISRAKRQL